jgi:hypothetical protein
MGLLVKAASVEELEEAVAMYHRGGTVGMTGVVDLEKALTLGPDDRAPILARA